MDVIDRNSTICTANDCFKAGIAVGFKSRKRRHVISAGKCGGRDLVMLHGVGVDNDVERALQGQGDYGQLSMKRSVHGGVGKPGGLQYSHTITMDQIILRWRVIS